MAARSDHRRRFPLAARRFGRPLHRLQRAAQIPGPPTPPGEVVEDGADGARRAAAEAALKRHLHLAAAALPGLEPELPGRAGLDHVRVEDRLRDDPAPGPVVAAALPREPGD